MGVIVDTLKALSKDSDPKKRFVSAIILAGGSGTRMGAGITKQLMPLCDKPVIVHTLLAFERCECINEIIVSAREDEMGLYKRFADGYGITKLRGIVKGGGTRQQSVFNALKHLDTKCEYIAIHDGARPLITPEQIEKCAYEAVKHDCACAASPAKDTVKIADAIGYIASTPERARVWCAATPQIFRSEIYRAAAFYAKRDGYEGTDDASLVEALGFKVKLVDCGYENIKITTPDDITTAQMILEKRNEKQ